VSILHSLDKSEQLKRVKRREVDRYIEAALVADEKRHKEYQDFMVWNFGTYQVVRLDSKNTTSEFIRVTELEIS